MGTQFSSWEAILHDTEEEAKVRGIIVGGLNEGGKTV